MTGLQHPCGCRYSRGAIVVHPAVPVEGVPSKRLKGVHSLGEVLLWRQRVPLEGICTIVFHHFRYSLSIISGVVQLLNVTVQFIWLVIRSINLRGVAWQGAAGLLSGHHAACRRDLRWRQLRSCLLVPQSSKLGTTAQTDIGNFAGTTGRLPLRSNQPCCSPVAHGQQS